MGEGLPHSLSVPSCKMVHTGAQHTKASRSRNGSLSSSHPSEHLCQHSLIRAPTAPDP